MFETFVIHCSHFLNISRMGTRIFSHQNIPFYDGFIRSGVSFCKSRANCFFDFLVRGFGLNVERIWSDLDEYFTFFKETILVDNSNKHSAVGYEDASFLFKG